MPNKKSKKPAPKKSNKVAPKKVALKKVGKAKAKAKVVVKVKNNKKPVKPVKKVAVKIKKPVKKIAVKKAAPKAAKKIVKKVVVKKNNKIKAAPKKVEKKLAKKIAAKSVKKSAKPEIKKPLKTKAVKEEIKKPLKIKEVKIEKEKPLKKESLADRILAKNVKKEEKPKEVKAAPIKIERFEGRSKVSFKVGQYAVYPSHGVGKIIDIESTEIMGQEFKCYLMNFEKERLSIKIPVNNAEKIGLRHLISKKEMDEVFVVLRSGIKKLKGMWSRRAQEYETKINSGDIMLLAEVLRDLTRDIEDSERSYSERIIYETAIYRLASEYMVIYGVSYEEAKDKVVIIAKDKLDSEPRAKKDDFDDFDNFDKDSAEEEEDDEEEEEEDDDFNYNLDDEDFDDDDDKPKKKKKK